jgi:hypothetical protein
MLYNILGIIYIGVSVWLGIFILRKKKNMPFDVYRLKKENYLVIDKDKFNSIMIKQNLSLLIWILLSGVICIYLKMEIGIILPAFSIFVNMIFAVKAKKYIKSK